MTATLCTQMRGHEINQLGNCLLCIIVQINMCFAVDHKKFFWLLSTSDRTLAEAECVGIGTCDHEERMW
jgi:hypothetical protein